MRETPCVLISSLLGLRMMLPKGKFPILLASDLASRGIHVPNVHYVINYDFPGSLDQVSSHASRIICTLLCSFH